MDGQPLSGNTSTSLNSAGTFSVASALQLVNASSTYTCTISNSLVAAVSQVAVGQGKSFPSDSHGAERASF